ncbi:hypothetical protein [Aliihoeflea sp. 40Bstr573]|uniref:hypothetical protein n=1 Tax=Aliihoeflea sp. 40Bstr573 TaxID=2696467 RepID=UPI0020944664|nr:hypothetical protein [Aliihoeflea sp. 40Bstr573]MCO6389367.1 hypothetical protein [Aliihoeflea sp. 40Bstr573]
MAMTVAERQARYRKRKASAEIRAAALEEGLISLLERTKEILASAQPPDTKVDQMREEIPIYIEIVLKAARERSAG